MAASINLSALTFSADQLRQMNELVVTAVLEAPELSQFHTLATGIRNDREIGLIPGTLGLMGKAAQGCDPVADTLTDTAVRKLWSPKRIQVLLEQCYTDVETSLAKLARNLGVEVADLTTTEYFAFIVEILQRDLPKMILRHAWLGDTAAANVLDSPAGVFTTGVDTDYFNVINGFFKQLATIYGTTAARKTTISANAQATTALQFSAFSNTDAFTALNSVVDEAAIELSIQPDRIILSTKSVMDRARRYLQDKGIVYKIELATSGLEIMQWDGITYIAVPLWDQWIRAYQSNGTKLNSPHRIVYTTKSNLVIGMEGLTLFNKIDTYYDKKSHKNYIEVMDAFDAKVLDDNLVQVGI